MPPISRPSWTIDEDAGRRRRARCRRVSDEGLGVARGDRAGARAPSMRDTRRVADAGDERGRRRPSLRQAQRQPRRSAIDRIKPRFHARPSHGSASRRAPRLEARPVAPVEHEALDREGAEAGRRAHHAGAAELEAALLDDPPGAGVGHPVGAPQAFDAGRRRRRGRSAPGRLRCRSRGPTRAAPIHRPSLDGGRGARRSGRSRRSRRRVPSQRLGRRRRRRRRPAQSPCTGSRPRPGRRTAPTSPACRPACTASARRRLVRIASCPPLPFLVPVAHGFLRPEQQKGEMVSHLP